MHCTHVKADLRADVRFFGAAGTTPIEASSSPLGGSGGMCHVAGCAESDEEETVNRKLEGATDSAAAPDLTNIQPPRNDDRDLSRVYADHDLHIPVVELGFG